MNTRMPATQNFLTRLGLPTGDAFELPTSAKRFPDGAQYRFEIPSCEGPRALARPGLVAARATEGTTPRFPGVGL